MITRAFRQIQIAMSLLVIFSLLTGLVYPLFVCGMAQLLFPWQANGSLLKKDNVVIGSMLIGQEFSSVQYFWGRPSATTPFAYNAVNSSGSNLGPSNKNLATAVQARVGILRKANPQIQAMIPLELVTSSASGLDPEISIHSAMYQVPRLAQARKIDPQLIHDLIKDISNSDIWGIFGTERVNVLQLNLALDQISLGKHHE
jgi:K+-transporting ATPase ATPase C chain